MTHVEWKDLGEDKKKEQDGTRTLNGHLLPVFFLCSVTAV